MAISSAYFTARSAISATDAWADTVASNVANAQTPGYVRRHVALTTNQLSDTASVEVSAVRRQTDASLTALHRDEVARFARQGFRGQALQGYLSRLGQPSDELSPAARFASFASSFDLLASTPSDAGAQRGVLDNAMALVSSLNDSAATLRRAGQEIEIGLTRDVATVNDLIENLQRLDKALIAENGETAARASLMDRFDQSVDALAEYMDIRVTHDPDGRPRVHTSGGTALLERGKVPVIEWDNTSQTLSADGQDITPFRPGVRSFGEGKLAAAIELHSHDIPRMKLQLDAFAGGLIRSFEAADASLDPGEPGLCTDAGGAFDPADTAGLAERLAINSAVIPEQGGAVWRLRDGIGAGAQGPAGSTEQIGRFIDALAAEPPGGWPPESGLADTGPLGRYAAEMVSDQQQVRAEALRRGDELNTAVQALGASRSGTEGVNVDEELQLLMQIEQAYGANATVLQTLNQLMQTLLDAF